MNNESSCEISEELKGMGFKDFQVEKLRKFIVDSETLQQFHNFIILHEDERMTKLLLVHKFILHMQEKNSFADSIDFINQFRQAESEAKKSSLLNKLFGCVLNHEELKKVLSLFEKFDMVSVYDRIVNYRRNQRTSDEMIFLLENLPIS